MEKTAKFTWLLLALARDRFTLNVNVRAMDRFLLILSRLVLSERFKSGKNVLAKKDK